MGYQHDRESFMLQAGRMGLSEYTTRALLRHASTLQRLAAAQCNGDWPADNGVRSVESCPVCEGGFVRSVFRASTERAAAEYSAHHRRDARGRLLICPDCRTAELVRALLDTHNEFLRLQPVEGRQEWEARIEGDPRGYALRLVPRGTSDEDYQSGRVRPVYVPGRER